MECPLQTNGERLEPCVTAIQEEWDSFIKTMNKKGTKKCGNSQSIKQCDSSAKNGLGQ